MINGTGNAQRNKENKFLKTNKWKNLEIQNASQRKTLIPIKCNLRKENIEIEKKGYLDLLTYTIYFFFYEEVSVSRFVHSHQSSIAEESSNFPKKFRHYLRSNHRLMGVLQSIHIPKFLSPLPLQKNYALPIVDLP